MLHVVLLFLTLTGATALCQGTLEMLDGVEDAQDFDIVYPLLADRRGQVVSREVRMNSRRRRETAEDEVHIILPLAGRKLHLELKPSFDTIPTVVWQDDSSSSPPPSPPECFLRGRIRSQSGSLVALSACEGLSGLVRTTEADFILSPLVTDNYTSWNSGEPHVLRVAAAHRQRFQLRQDQVFPEDDLAAGSGHDALSEPTLFSELESGNYDSFLNFSKEQWEGYVADPVWEPDTASGGELGPSENVSDLMEAYWADPSTINSNSVPQSLWLLLAVGVDGSVVNFHGKSHVQDYVLTLLNIVSAIFEDPSLGADLKLGLLRVTFFDELGGGRVFPGSPRRSLEGVNSWNNDVLANLAKDPGAQLHDAAIWLTRLDLGGPSGYAPVAGMCDPKRSCSLNQDEGLSSAFILAHELGHMLGMTHDGDYRAGNRCDREASKGSVMAPLVAATFTRFLWSTCSAKEFRAKSDKWTCLRDVPGDASTLASSSQVTYTLDQQCRLEFGDGYGVCTAVQVTSDPCQQLWCSGTDSPGVCRTKRGPPLEGTPCGNGKHCADGACVRVPRISSSQATSVTLTTARPRGPLRHNPRHGQWSSWHSWGPCSRSCGVGARFRSRTCNNPAPAFGGNNCPGSPEEWELCNLKQCPIIADFRAQQCARLAQLVELDHKQGNLTWRPHQTDQDSLQCRLLCKTDETDEVFMGGERDVVIDGTPCSYDSSRDVCIQGVCRPVGCDGVLGSRVREDRCGVCSGKGTTCKDHSVTYRRMLQDEPRRLGVIPRGARSILIEEIPTNIGRIRGGVISLRGRQSRHWILPASVALLSRREVGAGTRFHYDVINGGETVWAKGPLLEEVILLAYPLETGHRYVTRINYSLPADWYNDDGQLSEFGWQVIGWSSCSVPCGRGHQRLLLSCRHRSTGHPTSRRKCPLDQKPQVTQRSCNDFSCHFQWAAGPWEGCSATCGNRGKQRRQLYCLPTLLLDIPVNDSSLIKYALDPQQCQDTKPVQIRKCNQEPCPGRWITVGWEKKCGRRIEGNEERQQRLLKRCRPLGRGRPFHCQPEPEEWRNCATLDGKKLSNCQSPHTDHKDLSRFCRLRELRRYCSISPFRQMCCQTCSLATNSL